MITSELLKIPNTDNISTEYIEMELKKKNITFVLINIVYITVKESKTPKP